MCTNKYHVGPSLCHEPIVIRELNPIHCILPDESGRVHPRFEIEIHGTEKTGFGTGSTITENEEDIVLRQLPVQV